MPKKAMKYNLGVWEEISAANCTINDVGGRFRCCTDGCCAEMSLVSASESKSAYFRSKDKKQHISVQCVKNSIVFNPSEYNENSFDLDFAFASMMGNTSYVRRGNTGTRQGNVGGGKRLRIHTLPMLYAMCISKAKNETYNGILIDDILVDEENFERYHDGIEGFRIVETSFYYYSSEERSIVLNYPVTNRGNWVKIIFENEDLFKKQRAKLANSLHIEPIIIAGDWKKADKNEKHHSECTIYNEKQIYYATIQ